MMIRMAFMTDQARVIGASTPEGNARRFPRLPKQLPEAMGKLYQTDNIVFGSASLMTSAQARNNKYVITRDGNFQLPKGAENTIICTDPKALIEQYADAEEELLVAGGLTLFKLFLPYAEQLDVVESDELVPGDLTFTEWEDDNFELGASSDWEGFRVLHYTRQL